jgi:putative ABC transport system permease protein
MNIFLQDLQYALRRLKNDPAFAAVAILTLALGIGANSAIFSIVNAVLLQPLPYREPSRVVVLMEHMTKFPKFTVSYQNYVDFRDQSHSFESVGAVRNYTATMTGEGDPERLSAQMATASMFNVLGIRPEAGRFYTAAEDRVGGAPVALISHGLWQRRFSGSSAALGRSITIDNTPYEIVGVLPASYRVLQSIPDVVLPFEPWTKTLPNDRAWHPGILPIARLKHGVTFEQAAAEMTLIAKRLEEQYPVYNTGVGAVVVHIQEQVVENVRPALLVLMGAVGFVLLIACSNVANLLLVRAAARQREIAVRSAIGARRSRIVRQLLTESVLLAVLGAGVGLAIAWAAMPPLLRLAGSTLPNSGNVSLDLWVLAFTTLITITAGVLFGMAPARQSWRMDLREALNETDRSTTAPRLLRLRSALVVIEIGFAMLLLVGAALLLTSFERLASVSPGFLTDHILIADLPLARNAYRKPEQRISFFDRVLERSATLPGVTAVGAASFLPVSGQGSAIYFNIEGRPPKGHEYMLANYRAVSPGYLHALGIPLLQGRWIEENDREKSLPVVVINSAMAKAFFPNDSPLGKHMQVGGLPNNEVPWMEVVGIVGDVRQSLATEAPTEFYVPYPQADQVLPVFGMSVALRTQTDPMSLAGALRSVVHDIDRNQPVVKLRTMEDTVGESIAQPRFRTVLLALFAGIALALAAVGIFSVMAYSVAQRRRELGVRIALGASRSQILQLVLGHGLRLTIFGLALGLGAAFALTRYLSTMLFAVKASDPPTLVAVSAILLAIAMAACGLPALRATRVDPISALRDE